MNDANTFAWVVLFASPVLSVIFFSVRRHRARLARTTAWAMILPVMFVPSALQFDPPMIPALDKHRLSFLAIALSLRLFHRNQVATTRRERRFPLIVLSVMVLGAFATSCTNADLIAYGRTTLPSFKPYDAFAASVSLFLDSYLPFVVGQRVFRTERDLGDLFHVLAAAALIYLPLCLVELRLSPQFHNWIYGYHPSDFIQTVRGGSYRPMVFMNHGLSVAMFAFSTLASSLTLRRVVVASQHSRASARVTLSALFLLTTKSFGALSYGLSTLTAHLLLDTRAIARCVLVLCAMFVVYPLSRTTGFFPAHEFAGAIARINPDRAQSLDFRFLNEDALLAHAHERPLFGWGGFGRNRVYDDDGKDIAVTDGYWIMTIGAFGYVGFVAYFALLVVPLVRYVRVRPSIPAGAQILLGGLALMLAMQLLDLIPNARSDLLPMAYAGALFTLSGLLRSDDRERDSTALVRRPREYP